MPAPSDALAALACDLAESLPPPDIRTLADAVSHGRHGLESLQGRSSIRIRAACTHLLSALAEASDPAQTAQHLAGLLLGASTTLARSRAQRSIDVVWTGPESSVTTSRLTAPVVVALIDEAQNELLIASYATHTEPRITAALHRASTRGVDITLICERPEDNPSYKLTRPPFPTLKARRLAWPARHRQPGAALHLKAIIVDHHTALIGSANLTNRAIETNLECGVLLRGGPEPAAIRQHLFDLYHRGVLVRVTPTVP